MASRRQKRLGDRHEDAGDRVLYVKFQLSIRLRAQPNRWMLGATERRPPGLRANDYNSTETIIAMPITDTTQASVRSHGMPTR